MNPYEEIARRLLIHISDVDYGGLGNYVFCSLLPEVEIRMQLIVQKYNITIEDVKELESQYKQLKEGR
jgi:hypothetical protein